MKTERVVIRALFLIAMLAVLVLFVLTEPSPPAAQAACPFQYDLFCAPWWTPKLQMQKERYAFLDKRIAEGNDRPWLSLDTCDAVCITKYDENGSYVLRALATKNGLPYDKVVLAYLVTWDQRAAAADALLGAGKWDMNDTYAWLNDFTDELRVNHVFRLVGTKWCIAEEYGGVCPGKWD